ncbi:MAG: hypothetical protein J0H41_20265 [Rhizobiales bacterium]|nr:hypothetical protein [Hyphomicrobiales bacterium]
MATKPVKTAAETVQDAAQETVAKVQDAVSSFGERIEIPAAARELVQRATSTAKEKLADIHANAAEATASYEKVVGSFVNSGVTAMRGLLQAHHDNSLAMIATVEKLVAAKSFQEACQIQSDFARDFTSANWARAQSAAETVKANMQDGVKLLQGETAKVVALAKKAA